MTPLSEEEILAFARSRPAIFGLDGSFGGYVAFFMGMESARSPGLVAALEDWLVEHTGRRTNQVWYVRVLEEAGLTDWPTRDWRRLEPEDNARVVAKLFELLEEMVRASGPTDSGGHPQ
ncbi:hypothetical protein [Streptacidiphilus melanogenes]|uniref:hypothetical protein n=1 Tax=Streptacidiphilus melanogenes TaxID=411235 RepID=UPI0005A70E79|nr:hypothetical protein [Streptacidiphilus melanogenes]